jgi:hypothetical protein
LSFSLLFSLVCRFSCFLLALQFFLLLDDLLELFLAFWSSSCASWGLVFELQTLCLLLSMDSLRVRSRNQVVSWFDCDESLTCRALNSNLGQCFICFTFIFVWFGESCLLVSLCSDGRCGMAGSDEDHGRSRRPGAEDRG